MNLPLTTWLLAGALAASLAWHLRPARNVPALDACGTCSASATDCSAAIASLDLAPEQRRALENWSSASCAKSAQSAARANELASELFALLAARELDASRARTLADEIGRLRAQALRECLDSVLEVRRVLSPEQVAELLGNCCRTSGE